MRLFRDYPKLLLLCVSIVAAYFVYALGGLDWLHDLRNGSVYLAVFIGGLLFSFGFTTPFAIGVFLEIGHQLHPILGGIIGGIGALLADLVVFEVMRFEFFHDEIHRIKSTRAMLWLHDLLHHERFPEKARKYLLWSFAGIIIASPLPDEFGVVLVSSLTDIKPRSFAMLCFCFNTLGIMLMLELSKIFLS